MPHGHELIFLDYSICGKNGEPSVTHVSVETGKVEVIAENFEEFINKLSMEGEDEDYDNIEVTKKLHGKILSDYIYYRTGSLTVTIILALLSFILIVFLLMKIKSISMLIRLIPILCIPLFFILRTYFVVKDIIKILKKEYECTEDKIKKIWLKDVERMCNFKNVSGQGIIISRKSKTLKSGDEVVIVFYSGNTYVVEKS